MLNHTAVLGKHYYVTFALWHELKGAFCHACTNVGSLEMLLRNRPLPAELKSTP